MPMPKRGYRWVLSPKANRPKVSDSEKARVNQLCDDFIVAKLKPKYLVEYNKQNKDRKMKDIYCKWYRGFIHFIAVYNDFRDNRILNEYEDKFARLEYLDNDRYLLSYLRHTGEWFELTYGKGVSLESAFESIIKMPH